MSTMLGFFLEMVAARSFGHAGGRFLREDSSELSSFDGSLVPKDVMWMTSECFFLGSPTVAVQVIRHHFWLLCDACFSLFC